MTPKEKAEELVIKFMKHSFHQGSLPQCRDHAKQCGLIAVNEILNNNCGSHTDESNATNNEIYCDEYFWQDVKTELENYEL